MPSSRSAAPHQQGRKGSGASLAPQPRKRSHGTQAAPARTDLARSAPHGRPCAERQRAAPQGTSDGPRLERMQRGWHRARPARSARGSRSPPHLRAAARRGAGSGTASPRRRAGQRFRGRGTPRQRESWAAPRPGSAAPEVAPRRPLHHAHAHSSGGLRSLGGVAGCPARGASFVRRSEAARSAVLKAGPGRAAGWRERASCSTECVIV